MMITNKDNSKADTKGNKTRQLIVDTAAKSFSKKGYLAIPLKEIATSVGMKTGSLYYHFSSKEELMEEVLATGMILIKQKVDEEMATLNEGASFQEVFKTAVRGHLKAILQHPDYTSTSLRNYIQIPPSVRDALHAKRVSYEQFWQDIITLGEKQGVLRKGLDTRLLKLSIFGCMNWASIWYKEGEKTIEEIATVQAEIFLHGCLAE